MANDQNFIPQTLIAEGKIVKLSDINPSTTYAQIGVWQENQSQSASSNNAYPSFVIPLSELIKSAPGGCPPITPFVIPQGTGPCIEDGFWAFAAKDIYPLTPCSNIGTITNRVGTIYMCSTIDYLTDLTWVNAGNERMRITAAGNLGIGTATPNAPLQFANNITNRKIVLYEIANTDHEFFGFGVNASELRYQVNQSTDAHIFYAGNGAFSSTQLMTIRGTGHVGIGTMITPTARLHVQGTAVATDFSAIIQNSTDILYSVRNDGIHTLRAPGNPIVKILSGGIGVEPQLRFEYETLGGGTQGTITGSNGLKLQGTGTTTLQVGANGVGIGIVTPIARLHVRGEGATALDIALRAENVAGSNLYNVGGTGQHRFNSYYDGGGTGVPNYKFQSSSGLLVSLESSAGGQINWDEAGGNVGTYTNAGGFTQWTTTNRFTFKGLLNQSKLWIDIANGYTAIGYTYFAATAQCHIVGGLTGTDYALIVGGGVLTDILVARNDGRVSMRSLPVSNVGLIAGDLWNNAGVVNIV